MMKSHTYIPEENAIAKNPIWRFLEEASVPWILTQQELQSEYTVEQDPISGDFSVEIKNNSELLQGMYKPLRFTASKNPSDSLPPKSLWGVFSKSEHGPRADFEILKDNFTKLFGAGIDISVSNTYSVTWNCWPAKLTLTVWPADLQSHHSTRAWTDPDREQACSLNIDLGLAFVASQQELCAYRNSSSIELPSVDNIQSEGSKTSCSANPPVYLDPVECYRRIENEEPEFDPAKFNFSNGAFLRLSADKKILYQGVVGGMRIFPVESIKCISVMRMTPAKGGGGAFLSIEISDTPDASENSIAYLCSANGADDLNNFATCLTNILKCKLELEPYMSDC